MNPLRHDKVRSTSSPRLTPRARVASFGLLLAALSVPLAASAGGSNAWSFDHLGLTAALGVAFALSERLIFHVEARNEAVSYTPSEVALAVGLVFLNPVEVVVARVVGAAVGMAIWRRPTPFKLAFNLAHFAFETAVALALMGVLARASLGVLATWVALLVSLSIALMAGGLVIATVISQFEGGWADRVKREILNSPVFYLPPAVLAASIAVPMTVDARLGVVAALPAPVFWLVLRSHGALIHRFTDLVSVHDFSRDIGDVTDLRDIATTAGERIALHTRADRVLVRLWQADGSPIDKIIGPPIETDCLPDRPDDLAWREILEERHISRIERGELGPVTRLNDAGFGEGLLAPIGDDQGPLGLVLVTDRNGVSSAFDADDIGRLTAMIQQLAVAVRKGHFHSQIQFEATHDRLTGLPNRSYFETWIDQSGSSDRSAAVLLIDLDRFKQINDAFGHHAGDLVLVEAANRIRSVCELGDFASRFGGDEFAVLADGLGADGAGDLAERISTVLEQPFDIGAATVAIAASIGIALKPDHARDSVRLLRLADIAMYDAKNRRTRASIYRDELDENDSDRLILLNDLRRALQQDAIEVHYQPQIELSTGRVAGVESLARWSHPQRGRIDPAVFIELAEQAGLIETLTSRVLRQATQAAADWNRRGWDLAVSVNVSAQSLFDEQLEVLVARELVASGLAPHKLVLEITETTMMGDPERNHRILHGLAELGVGLSVDDFGTGFSSLVNLRNLPVNELKIDRSFVGDMMSQHNDDVIVRSTIDLGHNLGLTVVAEGVETAETLQRLTDLGCDLAQGYLISRALPRAALEDWLRSYEPGKISGMPIRT